MVDCSIIICTRNRASMLSRTLERFRSVRVPVAWKVEMIVADNGSTDGTAEVIRSAAHPSIEILHLVEERPGKSRAQNQALRLARGEVLLFTDDDVEPAEDWIERMAAPIKEGRADGVVGGIQLAENLRRPWMTAMHEMWLATVSDPSGESPFLIGACMGVHRSVFERIGNFDEELGPGATGFGEETLLWRQMKEAGMRILPVRDTHVVHHPDASRLQRGSWLAAARRHGLTQAYIKHHWEHERLVFPRIHTAILKVKLFFRRLLRGRVQDDIEGCPAWEMSYLVRLETLRQWQTEVQRPRNYGRHGLARIRPNS